MRGAFAAVVLMALPVLSGCLTELNGLGPIEPKDYLQNTDYSKWVIEVDSASGKQPSADLLNFAKGRIQGVVNKPSGVEFHSDAALPAESRSWSTSDLLSYSASHLDRKTEAGTIVTHLIFLAGHSSSDNSNGKVLGVTIGHDLIVIFSDSVAGSCSNIGLPPCFDNKPLFRSVLVHEFGHALGLVDNGIPMVKNHEDSSHQGHSSSEESVMFWAAESSTILSVFTGNPPDDFDANDRADLRAAGGK